MNYEIDDWFLPLLFFRIVLSICLEFYLEIAFFDSFFSSEAICVKSMFEGSVFLFVRICSLIYARSTSCFKRRYSSLIFFVKSLILLSFLTWLIFLHSLTLIAIRRMGSQGHICSSSLKQTFCISWCFQTYLGWRSYFAFEWKVVNFKFKVTTCPASSSTSIRQASSFASSLILLWNSYLVFSGLKVSETDIPLLCGLSSVPSSKWRD